MIPIFNESSRNHKVFTFATDDIGTDSNVFSEMGLIASIRADAGNRVHCRMHVSRITHRMPDTTVAFRMVADGAVSTPESEEVYVGDGTQHNYNDVSLEWQFQVLESGLITVEPEWRTVDAGAGIINDALGKAYRTLTLEVAE